MNIFDYAIQKEKEGETLYRRLAQQVTNPSFALFFNWLADEELKHLTILESLKDNNEFIPHIENDPKIHFSQKLETLLTNEESSTLTSEVEALAEAYREERGSYKFYVEHAKQAPSPDQFKIFMTLAEEEKKHQEIIAGLIKHIKKSELDEDQTVLISDFD